MIKNTLIAAGIATTLALGLIVAGHAQPADGGRGMGQGGMGHHGMGQRGMGGDPAQRMLARFDMHDTNKDGFIDATELGALRGRIFERFDADKDGVVTRQEIEAGLKAGKGEDGPRMGRRLDRRIDRMMKRFDKNSDGKITRDEVSVDATPMLKLLDRDNDGKISKAEFQLLIDAMKAMRGEGGAR